MKIVLNAYDLQLEIIHEVDRTPSDMEHGLTVCNKAFTFPIYSRGGSTACLMTGTISKVNCLACLARE